MRLFTALTFPDDILDRLERLQDDLHVGRPVPRDNLHLTLVYLGEVADRQAEAVDDALLSVHGDPFALTLAGTGTFGGSGPGTVWIGTRPSLQLDALQRKVQSVLHGAGIAPARQRFRPHVTLAHMARGAGSGEVAELARVLSVWGAVECAPCVVTGFALFRSLPGRDGPRHEALADYPFGAAAVFGR